MPWLGFCALLFLCAGFFWGLFLAPPDYQQGDGFRLIYLHVPTAFLSISLYAFMAFLAMVFLIWRIKLAGMMIAITAGAGVMMAGCALITGAFWGKPMWGAWWVWDARLTSEFILFLLYLAILATHQAFSHPEQADKMAAILTLVGVVDLPIIHFSVYWWHTLHQGATLSLFAKPKIAWPMLQPLLLCLAGFACYCLWMILHKTRFLLLMRERRQTWVTALFKESSLCPY